MRTRAHRTRDLVKVSSKTISRSDYEQTARPARSEFTKISAKHAFRKINLPFAFDDTYMYICTSPRVSKREAINSVVDSELGSDPIL